MFEEYLESIKNVNQLEYHFCLYVITSSRKYTFLVSYDQFKMGVIIIITAI